MVPGDGGHHSGIVFIYQNITGSDWQFLIIMRNDLFDTVFCATIRGAVRQPAGDSE